MDVCNQVKTYCKNCKKDNWKETFGFCPLTKDMLGYLLERCYDIDNKNEKKEGL